MSYNKASDQRKSRRGTVEARKRRRWRLQPTLLVLEDRRLLSTFPVTNNAVDDVNTTGTLRWAIAQANAATSPSSIEIELGSTPATITLTQGQLELLNTSNPTTIYDGPGEGAVTVSGNNASRVFQVDSLVTASISGMTITGGNSGYFSNGGGLANFGTTTLSDCTVSDNTAPFFSYGGGVYNGGTLAMVNCTVSGNSVIGYGGGVSSGTFGNYGPTLTMTNCTVSANSGFYGGGLLAMGTATLTNTIIAGNSGGDIYAPPASGTNNLIGFGFAGGLVNGADGNLVGVTNPLLAPLASYGGPTQTMALLPGSPAIDAGTSTGAPATDQRGVARVGGVDIGAFESSGFTIAYTSGSGQSASGAFPDPLVATVTAINPNEPVAGGLVTFTPPASGASATISENPAVIAADGTASATATSNFIAGTYTVSATANGAPGAASFTLTNYAVVSIAVSPGNPSLAVGVSGQFTAVGTFTDGSTQDITDAVAWTSGTPSVATISGTGVATGVALGTTEITASFAGITSPDDTLTVIAPSFVVNTTADPSGFYTGTTSLRDAIESANVVPGQTITFASSVFGTPQTIDLMLGQLELSDTTGTTTITGPAARVTVSGGGASRVFQVDGGVTASISGLKITGGTTTGSGGGLADYGSTVTLTNCTVSGNSAFDGGGLANFYGMLTLTNCTVSGNSATYGAGGGVNNRSGTTTLTNCTISGNSGGSNAGGGGVNNDFGTGTVTLTNCTLSQNDAGATGSGGGVQNLGTGPVTLTGCTVSGNTAYRGGGISNYIQGSTMVLSNCTVSENSSTVVGGGGLENRGALTLSACAVSGNSSSDNGGGLANYYGGMLSLTNCTVSGNSAHYNGGGLANDGGTLNLTNCTISGNTASLDGGGLWNWALPQYGLDSTATLTGCTVSGNSAMLGGGIFNQGTLSVGSSNINNNTATSAGGGISTTGTGSSATITNSNINSNQVNSTGTALGGGIDCEQHSTLSLTNCNVNANQANGVDAKGGGIYALDSTVDLENSNVNGNKANGSADGEGGGIYAWDTALSLVNTNVKGNKATTAYNDIFNGHP